MPKVRCRCGRKHQFPKSYLGKRLKCPGCGVIFRLETETGDAPYRFTGDALRHWLETPTAVAVRLAPDGRPELLVPFGLDDLTNLVIRPTPHARAKRMAAFRVRLAAKDWLRTWPKVRVVLDPPAGG